MTDLSERLEKITGTKKEIWKDIPNFEGFYQVSNFGHVKSVARLVSGKSDSAISLHNRVLKPSIDSKGYQRVDLSKYGVRKIHAVHRLVLWAFTGPCPAGEQGAHEDGDPSNNNLKNLSWKTSKANHADKIRHGTDIRGEQHGSAKLTEEDVLNIRSRYTPYCPNNSTRALAREFGVGQTTVSDIILGKKWAHI